jgi:hypothetical protein
MPPSLSLSLVVGAARRWREARLSALRHAVVPYHPPSLSLSLFVCASPPDPSLLSLDIVQAVVITVVVVDMAAAANRAVATAAAGTAAAAGAFPTPGVRCGVPLLVKSRWGEGVKNGRR